MSTYYLPGPFLSALHVQYYVISFLDDNPEVADEMETETSLSQGDTYVTETAYEPSRLVPMLRANSLAVSWLSVFLPLPYSHRLLL